MENLTDFYNAHREKFISDCTACGLCVDICPQKPNSKVKDVPALDLMEMKMAFLRDGEYRQEVYDSVFFCPPCLKCKTACPEGIDMSMVNEVIRVEFSRKSIKAPDPIYTCLPEQRVNFFDVLHSMQLAPSEAPWLDAVPADPPQSDLLFFGGCLGHSQPDKLLASIDILKAMGADFISLGGMIACCSDVNSVTGNERESDKGARELMAAFAAFQPKQVLLGCNTCVYRLNKIFADFIEHDYDMIGMTEFVANNLDKITFKNEIKKRVTYQDVCKLGRGFGDWETPRRILRAIPGIDFVEMASTCENTLCCGGVAQICEHETTEHLNHDRMKEAQDVGAEAIVTIDLGCHLALAGIEETYGIEVINIWNLLAEAMGFEHEDKLKKFRQYRDTDRVLAEAGPVIVQGKFSEEEVREFWEMLRHADFA